MLATRLFSRQDVAADSICRFWSAGTTTLASDKTFTIRFTVKCDSKWSSAHRQQSCREVGPGASWIHDNDPSVHEAHYLKLDSSNARTELGWHLRLSLETALRVDTGLV
jgi:hypothetical protein